MYTNQFLNLYEYLNNYKIRLIGKLFLKRFNYIFFTITVSKGGTYGCFKRSGSNRGTEECDQ